LRWCWNWQTGMVEGHVPKGVWVQLPPSAQAWPLKSGLLHNLFVVSRLILT
jgi:hypothetical protein